MQQRSQSVEVRVPAPPALFPPQSCSTTCQVIAEVWEGTGALLLQVWSLHIMFNRNGGCTMLNTSSCFQDWPSSHRAPSGTVSAIQGVAALASTSISALAVYVNLMRSALLPLVVFNFTNPLLNAARAFNMLQMQTCKKIAFLAFTIVFFVARIVLVPPVVLRVAVIGMRQIPLHRGIGYTINFLLVSVLHSKTRLDYTINFLLDAELPKEVSAAQETLVAYSEPTAPFALLAAWPPKAVQEWPMCLQTRVACLWRPVTAWSPTK
eukprot:gene9715-7584_t